MADQQLAVWSMTFPEVVVLPAELDGSNGEYVKDRLKSAIGRAIIGVVADMTQTTSCDSSGLDALLEAIGHASSAHVELRIALPDEAIARALRLPGLDHAVAVYPSVSAALAR
jgi:anti-sigma B factor antagonist